MLLRLGSRLKRSPRGLVAVGSAMTVVHGALLSSTITPPSGHRGGDALLGIVVRVEEMPPVIG
jgi:hypothetical protein